MSEQPYNEEIALNLLQTDKEACIIYCCSSLPGIYLSRHKWACANQENREDLLQELCISVINAINSYNGSVKLLTWVWSRMRYRMLDIGKKEVPYYKTFEQSSYNNCESE